MDRGEHGIGGMRLVEGPVVDRADPFDAESPTTDLAHLRLPPAGPAGPPDPLVPAFGSGFAGWLAGLRFTFRRCGVPLFLVALFAAVPMHFFVGRVEVTVVAAPALSELAGVFGLLLLPLMWLAYFTVSALPLVISVAGVAGVTLPTAADGRLPAVRAVWALVAYRLRPLWLWFAAFGVVTQALPLFLTTDRLGSAVEAPLTIGLGLLSTAVLTFTGMLGCVVLIERGQGPRRAMYLFNHAAPGGLIVAALALTVLPRVAGEVAGAFGSTLAAAAAALLWAVAALVTYAQARAAEAPVTSGSLRAELAAPDVD